MKPNCEKIIKINKNKRLLRKSEIDETKRNK